jgi:hypothetical protein
MIAPLLFALVAFQTPTATLDTAYFQQGVNYRIEATLDEPAHQLHARMRLRYRNNSPHTLDTLWFHLELNAFRPNSEWARRELQFTGANQRRFTDIGPDDYAFERIRDVNIGGTPARAFYPLAPDSTVVGFALATPLHPGDSTIVTMDWDSRLSTAPITRRQGRRGRHYDFAQWYPRLAVYDREGWEIRPLLPQGEFYGEFGSFDITLDLASDQVVGGTGVPVEGDPGWARAAAQKGLQPTYQRDFYAAKPAEPLGLLSKNAARGRKHVRWRAEHVHHVAWTTNPEYVYEEGAFEDVVIHVLYQPGDTAGPGTWRDVAASRTATMLAWYDTIFGDFPYPQITNVHRIEGGGTEFPMMMMNGSSSQGLILHEGGHNYTGETFGNNEWKEGWLDEGFASFLTDWWVEVNSPPDSTGAPVNPWTRPINSVRALERAGRTQPIDWPSAEFRDFGTYNAMTYTKPEVVYNMLRDVMGDADFRKAMRYYFDNNKLRHVREEDLLAAVERFHPDGLDWFFHQWLHTTDTLDYRVGDVSTQQEGREWVTRVEILRGGEAWMPVTLAVGDARVRIDSKDKRHIYFVRTATRPDEVVIDPDGVILDMEPSNNRAAVR